MPLVLGGSAVVTPPYSIDNSCRFNEDDDAKLVRTQTAGDRTKWTLSMWVKRCNLTLTGQTLVLAFAGDSFDPGFLMASFMYPNKFNCYNYHTSATLGHIQSSAYYRDIAAWYHLVCVWDTGAAAADRMRLYTNGVEETAWAIDANPSLDEVGETNNSGSSLVIGSKGYTTTNNFDGYIAEAILCDGQAYGPTDFGEFDSDSPTIWKPKDPSGLTFGTNGFWLDFKDSADLGNDVSGEGNDFTVTNLTASDQATDTPTNNFCTMNPLDNYYASGTFSEGNCNIVHPSSSNNAFCTSTFWLSSGKWYAEAKVITTGTGDGNLIGMSSVVSPASSNAGSLGETTANYGYYGNDGGYRYNASTTSYGSAYGVNAIIGIYLDLDNNKLYFGEDGTIQNSGTGITITAASLQPSGLYTMAGGDWTSSTGVQWAWNFGGCSAFDITSANQDANGYGNFEFDPSDGGSASFDGSAKDFLAICTKNLGSDGG